MSAFSKPLHRILIVADDSAVQELLSRCLCRKGYGVAAAFTAREGVELVTSSQFHLVIVDENLRGGCGLDLVRLLKRTHAMLPVIILCEHSDPEFRKRALSCGANGFFNKTDSLKGLIVEVGRHVRI